MEPGGWLQTLLPFAIIAIVFARRWKQMAVARPLKLTRMWIVPLIYGLLVGVMLWAMPPSAMGWALFAGGLLGGSALGWQRARLMQLHLDPESGAVMIRQSPAGLAVIVGLLLVKRLALPAQPGQGAAAHAPHALPLATDALLGFALGMILGYRIELWRRAKALHAA